MWVFLENKILFGMEKELLEDRFGAISATMR